MNDNIMKAISEALTDGVPVSYGHERHSMYYRTSRANETTEIRRESTIVNVVFIPPAEPEVVELKGKELLNLAKTRHDAKQAANKYLRRSGCETDPLCFTPVTEGTFDAFNRIAGEIQERRAPEYGMNLDGTNFG